FPWVGQSSRATTTAACPRTRNTAGATYISVKPMTVKSGADGETDRSRYFSRDREVAFCAATHKVKRSELEGSRRTAAGRGRMQQHDNAVIAGERRGRRD